METKFGQVELLNVSDYAKNQYKRFIRGNWNDSDEIIQKKLTRNFILGCNISIDNSDEIELRAYGNLYIYRKGNEIIKVGCSRKKCKAHIYINTREKNDLDKLFEIVGEI
jgi:hypothetical protein